MPAWHALSKADLSASMRASTQCQAWLFRTSGLRSAEENHDTDEDSRWPLSLGEEGKAFIPSPSLFGQGQTTGRLQHCKHNVRDWPCHLAPPDCIQLARKRRDIANCTVQTTHPFCCKVSDLPSLSHPRLLQMTNIFLCFRQFNFSSGTALYSYHVPHTASSWWLFGHCQPLTETVAWLQLHKDPGQPVGCCMVLRKVFIYLSW